MKTLLLLTALFGLAACTATICNPWDPRCTIGNSPWDPRLIPCEEICGLCEQCTSCNRCELKKQK